MQYPKVTLFLLFVVSSVSAQDRLVAKGEKVTQLAGGFKFTEGPAVASNGDIFFSDIPNLRIHKWSVSTSKLSTVREQSGGANGLYFDKKGQLVACEGRARRVTRMSKDGKVSVLTDQFDGKKLNSPNDLWPDEDGGIYFTDPRYGNEDGLEQGGFHVYYISSAGKVTRVLDNLVKPNGVVGSSDGTTLYVADPGDRKTYKYKITAPGQLGDRKLVARQGSDGMTLDSRGNLYLTSAGVDVYAPDGTMLATISVPERPTNVCFGGKGRDTLFITARTGFYSVKMNVTGQK